LPDLTFQKVATPISTEDYLYFYRNVGKAYNLPDRLSLERIKLYDVINSQKKQKFLYTLRFKILLDLLSLSGKVNRQKFSTLDYSQIILERDLVSNSCKQSLMKHGKKVLNGYSLILVN